MEINGTYYAHSTPRAVMVALESLRQSGHLARVWYGYTDNSDPDAILGWAWPEEHDVLGSIGRSTGNTPVPILIEEGEDGGPHILDHRIVRLDDATEGRTLYQHPEFSSGFEDAEIHIENTDDFAVRDNSGEIVSRFKRFDTAGSWIDFMNGDSYTHPQAGDDDEPPTEHHPIAFDVIEDTGDPTDITGKQAEALGMADYPRAIIRMPDGRRWSPRTDEDAAALRDWLETHYDI